jgi:glycine cleavage system H protein
MGKPAFSPQIPADVRYTKDHEWVRVEGQTALMGITDFAQHALGDVTYVDLPPVGKEVGQFEELTAVESAKAASDVFAPLSGTVSAINDALENAPERINSDPYGAGWICRLKDIRPAELENLLTPEQYKELLSKEGA